MRSYEDKRIVLVCNEKNIGLTKSLNKGLSLARGKYIARQDADDISLNNRFECQVKYLEANSAVGLLGTSYYLINAEGQHLKLMSPAQSDTEIKWKLLFANTFCHSSIMFRKQLWETYQFLYDENLVYSQDYELWCRFAETTMLANLPTPLVMYRTHSMSISTSQHALQMQILAKISATQIARLLPQDCISEEKFISLRHCYNCDYKYPDSLSFGPVLLVLFRAFEKRADIDRKVISAIQTKWITKLVKTIPVEYWNIIIQSGLLKHIFKINAVAVIGGLTSRILPNLRRFKVN
ncbi:MAG: glycosyltransferase [Caldilineaceae bacterium]